MAAGDFYFTNPEVAKQVIAQTQERAAATEAKSRENIAREQTASNRYITQASLADRDKDRAVRMEDLKLRREYDIANAKLDADTTRDRSQKERAKIQFQTIFDTLNNSLEDPPTPRELEAMFANAPDLTEDHRNAVKQRHATIVKMAKDNAATGDQIAKNYEAELKAAATDQLKRDEIYKRLGNDRNVIFDRVTGSVRSALRPPRVDPPSGGAPGSGVLRLPGSAGGAPGSGVLRIADLNQVPGAGAAGVGGGVTTISDLQNQTAGAPPGASVLGPGWPITLPEPAREVPYRGAPALRVSPFGGITFGAPPVLPTPPPPDQPIQQPSPQGIPIPQGPDAALGLISRLMRMFTPPMPIDAPVQQRIPGSPVLRSELLPVDDYYAPMQ